MKRNTKQKNRKKNLKKILQLSNAYDIFKSVRKAVDYRN